MVRKVAVFFTGGFTESGALQHFLEKINPDMKLVQFCPNKQKKRRGTNGKPHLDPQISGITGAGLLKHTYDYVGKYREEINCYDAVLIEDDLDGEYAAERVPGDIRTKFCDRTEQYKTHCNQVEKEIRERLQNPEMIVIQLYASPEIETWFLADWENSFGKVYGEMGTNCLTREENMFFSNRFHTYVTKRILKQYSHDLERYGYFDGRYVKLSDELIVALRDGFKMELAEQEGEYSAVISSKKELYYSKTVHGIWMLSQIEPKEVRKKCSLFFADGYEKILNMG